MGVLRPLLLGVLLMLAIPSSLAQGSGPWAGPDDGAGGIGAEGIQGPAYRLGNPLLHVPLGTWVDTLRGEGYIAAVRQAQDAMQAESDGEDAALPRHSFLPLGDANGNGRDDVVLVTATEDQTTFEALDGGRVTQVLWNRTLEESDDIVAFLGGDFDEDGVLDFEVIFDEEPSGEESSTMRVELWSGRDLAVLGSSTMRFAVTYESSGPQPIPVGTYRTRFVLELQFVGDRVGVPGFARSTLRIENTESMERVVVVPTHYSFYYNFTQTYEAFALGGETDWASMEEGQQYALAPDLDGDDVPEVLVYSGYSYSASGSTLPGGIGEVGPLARPQPEPEPFVLSVRDGRSGETLWAMELPAGTLAFPYWPGKIYGANEVLQLRAIDPETYGERVRYIDGLTGEVVREDDDSRSVRRLGDANGDGRDDMLVVDYDEDEEDITLQALDGEFETLWERTIEASGSSIADLTRDDVRDIVLYQDRNLTVLDGRTGDDLWTRGDDRLADVSLTGAIAHGLPHRDVALLLSDAPDEGDLADHEAELQMRRGSDGAVLWTKPLYDPDDYEPAVGDDAGLWAGLIGDLDADGAQDLVVDFSQGYWVSMTTCIDGECTTTTEDSRDDDEDQALRVTLLVSGATGQTITRFDDMVLVPKIEVVREEPVDIAPAAESLGDQDAPGMPLLLLLSAIAAALLARRR